MKIESAIAGIDKAIVTGPRDNDVVGVVCDSRHVKPGFLFVAIAGVNQDGTSYIEDAIQRGATAIVSEQEIRPRKDVSTIRVPDARLALAYLSAGIHGQPADQLQMIGITGTNGKTTTAYMIRNILQADNRNPGLLGTVEYIIGARTIPANRTTPDAPTLQGMLSQMVSAGCKSAVMEVSSHSLVQKRTAAIDFDVGVFTNLTRDHLDYHKTVESYFDAKAMLFHDLGRARKHAVAVLNIDDQWGAKLSRSELKADVLTYGLSSEAMVYAYDVVLGSSESRFSVRTTWGSIKVRTHLMGRYNVYNALAAIATCSACGTEMKLMAEAMNTMPPVPGRLEEVKTGKGFQVFVDYAHTDDALYHVLKTLREITKGKLIAVFGCGGNRDKTKRPAMGKVAAQLADFSVLTSDNPRKEDPSQILAEIKQGFGSADNFTVIEDRAEAIRKAVEMAAKGDVVLVAGKGHENFQEFANTSVPFDDRQVVRKCL